MRSVLVFETLIFPSPGLLEAPVKFLFYFILFASTRFPDTVNFPTLYLLFKSLPDPGARTVSDSLI